MLYDFYGLPRKTLTLFPLFVLIINTFAQLQFRAKLSLRATAC